MKNLYARIVLFLVTPLLEARRAEHAELLEALRKINRAQSIAFRCVDAGPMTKAMDRVLAATSDMKRSAEDMLRWEAECGAVVRQRPVYAPPPQDSGHS